MNSGTILDIRYVAPVGIMLFFAFLFSPHNFFVLIGKIHQIHWLLQIVGVLGLGFMISSIPNFILRIWKGYVGNEVYGLDKTFTLTPTQDRHVAAELQSWIILDREDRKGAHPSRIPDQLHKRWNMAMANFNCAFAVYGGLIVAVILCAIIKETPSPGWAVFYWLIWAIFLSIFLYNGQEARKSVLLMDELLYSKKDYIS